ncbi:hypothetical protein EIP91_000368 [Steccherinum ochraceum]|uniref:Uncharacterized protein n=1 Tax=Steccherinum ochraceum TaxID=92696 RepID=A0A4R0RPI1_9APHY|nr:hypothetical protein EIP91_000368 [Steccherinum ochraceum]
MLPSIPPPDYSGSNASRLPDLEQGGIADDEHSSDQHRQPRNVRAVGTTIALTPYRLFSTGIVIGIGVPKAIASARGQTVASNTLDYCLGVIVAVGFIWGSAAESSNAITSWFFHWDITPGGIRLIRCGSQKLALFIRFALNALCSLLLVYFRQWWFSRLRSLSRRNWMQFGGPTGRTSVRHSTTSDAHDNAQHPSSIPSPNTLLESQSTTTVTSALSGRPYPGFRRKRQLRNRAQRWLSNLWLTTLQTKSEGGGCIGSPDEGAKSQRRGPEFGVAPASTVVAAELRADFDARPSGKMCAVLAGVEISRSHFSADQGLRIPAF